MEPFPVGFILGKYKLNRLLDRDSFAKLYQALSVTNGTTATISLRQRCTLTSSNYSAPLTYPATYQTMVEYPEWLANVVPDPKKDGKVKIEAEPKKCTFGVTYGKLLGYMVSERSIEVDLDKIKAILDMHVPKTEKEIRVPPMPGRPLFLYLSVSDMALGCMLSQIDDSGKERAIYYLSKRMLEYKMRYVMIESLFLALVWATRRLRHYMTEYSVHLISRLDPLRYLFDRPALIGRLMRWLDGAANHSRYGIGVLLVSPQGDHIPRFVRLAFPDRHPITNNIVEYEACILGLETALELGIRQMEVFGDSNLVLRQIQGDWKIKDVKLRSYHAFLELLVARFDDLRYVHLPRAHNWFTDALATLASSIDIPIDVFVHPLLIELRSGSQQSTASNGSQIRVEMKKLEPMEADHSKLKANFAGLRNQPSAAK
ncbi:hypothetical protein CK203_000008 [Vitis vinifera]|uniref:RNase H type-1 domain-containing protein n=1 Tax=Vitis vinifera TaxID=29760 RepID=A0A438KQE0_VITVI|nr:hypothetical protein CK203_000008 [Vitis vinifera]